MLYIQFFSLCKKTLKRQWYIAKVWAAGLFTYGQLTKEKC